MFNNSTSNFGIRGTGDSPRDVVFKTNAGEGKRFMRVQEGSGQLFQNFTLDYSNSRAGSLIIMLKTERLGICSKLKFVGFNPIDSQCTVDQLNHMALNDDARVSVDRIVRKGPTHIVSHGQLDGDSIEGFMWLGGNHEGELIVQNSHIEITGTNAIYASRINGKLTVRNCFFRNNNQANIRLGGGDRPAEIKNCIFEIDMENRSGD